TKQGRRPFVVPLGAGNPPLGALGYIRCAAELLGQAERIDHVVVASGSGQTHAGLAFGLRALGWTGGIAGICVRREAAAQRTRLAGHCSRLAEMLGIANPIAKSALEVHDEVLAPGYGKLNEKVAEAMRDCARLDGLILDPVYTARAMA